MHILIRASLLEDYMNLLSEPAFYITHKKWTYLMRTFKWESMFKHEEETYIAVAWISFSSLPSNFFCQEALFSLAAAVGKPLQVDIATKNKTRPSCARTKVDVDLMGEFPKQIKIGIKKDGAEVLEKWIPIKYDYVSKYCKTCSIQGHDEIQCYVKNPELFKRNKGKGEKDKTEGKEGKNQQHWEDKGKQK